MAGIARRFGDALRGGDELLVFEPATLERVGRIPFRAGTLNHVNIWAEFPAAVYVTALEDDWWQIDPVALTMKPGGGPLPSAVASRIEANVSRTREDRKAMRRAAAERGWAAEFTLGKRLKDGSVRIGYDGESQWVLLERQLIRRDRGGKDVAQADLPKLTFTAALGHDRIWVAISRRPPPETARLTETPVWSP